VPIDAHNERLLAEIRQAKEAYLLVLRQAFFDGLDPLVVWDSAIHGVGTPSASASRASSDADAARVRVHEEIPAKLGELVCNLSSSAT
jgi:hypothetical protein